MSKTTSNNDSEQMSFVGVDSLSDYTPHKLHLLLPSSLPVDIRTVRETTLIQMDTAVKAERPSTSKPKLSAKKRSFIRYFIPLIHPRSSSVHHEQDKYDQQSSVSVQSNGQCDMRFLIVRHGERVDRYYGANWYMLAFDRNDKYSPFHRNFPPNLPSRLSKYLWALDTPLTVSGMVAAENLGQVIGSKDFRPTYVYSSPAARCILTTIHILKGLGLQNEVFIRIEPGLLELGASRFGMDIFLQPTDWSKYGVNVDLSYQPMVTLVPSVENEKAYYLRSKYVIRGIEKLHNHSTSKPLNILIIAHATSPDTLTWDLIEKQPDINDLYTLASKVNYLHTVITERKPEEKCWSLKPMKAI